MQVHLDQYNITGKETPLVLKTFVKRVETHFKVDYPNIPAAGGTALRAESRNKTLVKYDIDYQNSLFGLALAPDDIAASWHQQYTEENAFPPGWEAVRDAIPQIWPVPAAGPPPALSSATLFEAANPPPTWFHDMLEAFKARFITSSEQTDVLDNLNKLSQKTSSFKTLLDKYDLLMSELPANSRRNDTLQRDDLLGKMNEDLRANVRLHVDTLTCTKQQLVDRAIQIDNEMHVNSVMLLFLPRYEFLPRLETSTQVRLSHVVVPFSHCHRVHF